MERDDLLTFRIAAPLKEALKKAAAHDERSMSMLATRILREWLVAHGDYEESAPQQASRGTRKR